MAEGERPNGPDTGGPQPSGTEEGSDEGLIQTFLIADIRGYTRFSQDHGDEAAGRLAARYAEVVTEVIEARGGAVVELTGDEAMCVFATTRRAIRAALDLQARFLAETENDPAMPLPVGIGIDTGEAVPVGAGFRGRALNLASRLCATARAGKILATREAVHMAGRMDGIHVEDRGLSSFKNIAEPVSVMRVTKEGEDPARWFAQHLPPPQSLPTSRASTKRVMIGAALAVVIAVGATIVLIPDDGDQTIAAGSVGFLDLSGSLDSTVGIGELPRGLATGAGSLWVTDQQSGSLIQVDPSTFQVEERIPVGVGPTGVAIASGLVWVANTDERTVSMVDPQARRVVQTVVVGNGPVGIVADGDRVWVANSVDATVTEIDATNGSVVETYPVGERPVALAVAAGAVWVANASDGTVSRVVSGDGATQTIPVGRGPSAIASGFGSLWVANAEDGTVTTIDPATGSVTGVAERVGQEPVALAAAGDGIWVASARDGTVLRIDPATTRVTDTYEIGNEPRVLTESASGLWVGVEASPALHRGGTLRLVSEQPMEIDPHGDDFVSQPVLASMYDGLLTYRRTGGAAGLTVVPDLAVSLPVPTDEGLTYTFTLREGIRFSNGHVLGPQDVVATFERVLIGNKYGRYYVPELVGWSTCTPRDPAACDLSEGVVPDEEAGTVTFHLVRPAPSFIKILAKSWFAIVPAGSPVDLESEPVPATGPYLIGDVGDDGSLVLERNPTFREWSADAQPAGFADRIEVTAGVAPDEQVSMVERGEADLALDGVPPDLIEELERRSSDQLVRASWPSIVALSLNTATYPFENADARRAVAYALERGELIRSFNEVLAITGGSTVAEEPVVTCQILPPNTPGYAPYCPYTRSGGEVAETWVGPDLSRAHQLVQRSGTAGAEVSIVMSPCLELEAELVADTLRGLGYRVVLETDGPLRPPEVECWFAPLAPDADVSSFAWLWDYPSPAQFLVPLLSCVQPEGSLPFDGSTTVTGAGDFSWNFTNFCDPEFDRRMQRALDLEPTDPYASARAFEALDHDLVDLAPLIPFGSAVDLWLVSKRVSNVEFSPELRLIVSQVWVR